MASIRAAIKAHRYLTILIAGLALLAVLAAAQNETTEWRNRHSLKSEAQRARGNGKDKVVIPGPRIEYGGEDMSLAEAVQLYSVLVAEPLESKVYVSDSHHIVTWYRFEIKETLALRPPMVCDTCPKEPEVPPDLRPAKSGEFLVSKIGGTAVIDGVEVTMNDADLPSLEIGKKYLVFVSLSPQGVAMFGGGPSNVLRINDFNKLEVLSKKNTRLHSEMRSRFNLDLADFRAHAKS